MTFRFSSSTQTTFCNAIVYFTSSILQGIDSLSHWKSSTLRFLHLRFVKKRRRNPLQFSLMNQIILIHQTFCHEQKVETDIQFVDNVYSKYIKYPSIKSRVSSKIEWQIRFSICGRSFFRKNFISFPLTVVFVHRHCLCNALQWHRSHYYAYIVHKLGNYKFSLQEGQKKK